KSSAEVYQRAVAADLVDALQRLDDCGADADLVRLAKACLAVDPAARPADGTAVVASVAAHQNGMRERLRQAEIDQARAEEERKRRRVQLALVASLLFQVMIGGGGAWLFQAQHHRRALESERQQGLAERAGRQPI